MAKQQQPPSPPPPPLSPLHPEPETAAAQAAAAVADRHRVGQLCETICKKYACAIQYCLERHQYQEGRCWKEIGNWDMCCDWIKEREALQQKASEEAEGQSIGKE